MHLEQYELKAGHNRTTFEFLSVGYKGRIKKVIQFQAMSQPGLFNLAFGDLDTATGKVDDEAVTNNGDSGKILASVVAAVYTFTEEYPEVWIYATGNTASRTRLYRMGIDKYLDIVREDFEIVGELENEWEIYEKGKNYEAFAVHRKKK